MEKFIEEITGTPAKVTKCRLSGSVIVATIENNELKENIMKRKGRLGEKRIYIENDLTWEERKRQERTCAWVKGEREER